MSGRYGGNIKAKNTTNRRAKSFDRWVQTFRGIERQIADSVDLNIFNPDLVARKGNVERIPPKPSNPSAPSRQIRPEEWPIIE